jgi:hypothetical protein
MFPPGELLGPDDWYPSDAMFPPGQLYLPTDGLFGSSGESEHGAKEDDADDGPWPPDHPAGDDEGPWPAPPGGPPA